MTLIGQAYQMSNSEKYAPILLVLYVYYYCLKINIYIQIVIFVYLSRIDDVSLWHDKIA